MTWISRSIVLALVAALLVVGFVAYRRSNDVPQVDTKEFLRIYTGDDHIRGNADAAVTVFVYIDLECQFCKRFHTETLPRIEEQFGDSIRIVYRHFPLPSRSRALPEAVAAECVARIGGERVFWGYVNAVFTVTSSKNNLDPQMLPDIAERLGISKVSFQRCIDEGGGKDAVLADIQRGQMHNISVTPTIVISDGYESVVVGGDARAAIVSGIEYMIERTRQ